MLGCSSVQTPGYGPELTPGYGPELSEERPEDKLLETQGIKLYQAIVGCVPYLAHVTRFDICYRVNELPGARSTPAMTYMTAAKHLLRYLKGSPDLAILQEGAVRCTRVHRRVVRIKPEWQEIIDRVPIPLWGAHELWIKDTDSDWSTAEAELMAITFKIVEVVYIYNFMIEPSFTSFDSVLINCDSAGALHIAGNSTYSSRTKHIALCFLFLRELVKSGKITIHYVATQAMLADCATKPHQNSVPRNPAPDRAIFPLRATVHETLIGTAQRRIDIALSRPRCRLRNAWHSWSHLSDQFTIFILSSSIDTIMSTGEEEQEQRLLRQELLLSQEMVAEDDDDAECLDHCIEEAVVAKFDKVVDELASVVQGHVDEATNHWLRIDWVFSDLGHTDMEAEYTLVKK